MAGPPTFHPWMLPGAAGVLLALAVLRTAWRRRGTAGSGGLAVLAVTTGWWCGLQVLIFAAREPDSWILLSRVQWLGIALTPPAWFLFSIDYAALRHRIPRLLMAGILAPCLFTVFLAWSNGPVHDWLWQGVQALDPTHPPRFRLVHGPWFDIQRLYSYALIALATSVLLWYLAQRPGSGRRLAIILLAPMPALIGNVVYVLPGDTRAWIDLTPSGLALGGGLIAWGLFRKGLLDLTPVARTSLVEFLRDGIVVVDARLRVTDANPVGQQLLRCTPGEPLPAPYRDWIGTDAKRVITLGGRNGGPERYVEWSTQPVGGEAGTAIVLRDVTERHHLESQLRATAAALATANERLETLAATDALTGLANRRAFDNVLAVEAERARRYRRPLSLVLVDLDHFKNVNDTWGHAAGDDVLRAVGRIIGGLVRETDLAARVGGEEFGMILPETTEAGAVELAERIRRALADEAFAVGDDDAAALRVTASAGTASTPVEDGYAPAALFGAADGALYEAKRTGRNRVVAHPPNVWLEEQSAGPAAGPPRIPTSPSLDADQVA